MSRLYEQNIKQLNYILENKNRHLQVINQNSINLHQSSEA